ncbi:MAG TPA: hypothetical protein ENN21_03855 [Spirochaetes bacterium]|nr:hypothetical protein [Spirochaetota bacterium]
MRKSIVFSAVACLCALSLFCGAKGGKYSDVADVMESMIKAQESYISSLSKVNSPAEMAAAVNGFTDTLEKLAPKMIELQKKYPELEKDENLPAELKALEDRMERNFESMADASKSDVIKKTMAYFSDAEVQKAFARMQKVMMSLDKAGK